MGLDLVSLTSPQSSSSSGALLAPGFRFHPTDEELVGYYLKRKICGKSFRLDAISEIDVYKVEPWDLPGRSKLKSRDLEWYFFSVLDKKYGNGGRTNRATEKGYWKTTGKDRAVSHKSQIVGMKKTLVYHHGRAPRGQRTNWVMHEYKLMDESLARAGIFQDAFVLCRIFQKSGPGPKNGEQYGAPLVEEEWEEDELSLVPGKEVVEEAVVSDDNDIYLDSSDLEQIFGGKLPAEYAHLPLSFNYGDSISQVQEIPVQENYQALEQEPENQYCNSLPLVVLPVQEHENQILNQNGSKSENQGFVVSESANNANDLNFLLDEPFFDAIPDGLFDDMAFLETDDLLNPAKVDPSGGVDIFEEYINLFDADQNNMWGCGDLFDQAFLSPELANGESKEETMGNHQLLHGFNEDTAFIPKQKRENVESGTMGNHQLLHGFNEDTAFISKQKRENVESGGKYSYIQKASHMLGGVSAPPALASEFPTKESALHLSSSLSSLHLSAGMIQIQKPKSNYSETSFVLSFGMCHNSAHDSLSKATSVVSRGLMCLMFFWVLVFSVTYKFGSIFCSGHISS